MNIELIAPLVVMLGGVLLGVKKYRALKAAIKDFSEALTAISAALEDDKVTKEEAKRILDEFGDVVADAKLLIGK